jgi:prolipoprotein diacylglyceryltransferase
MRFWIFITLYSLGAFLIGFIRADDMPIISGWRLDQIFDGVLTIIGMMAVILSALRARRLAAHPST